MMMEHGRAMARGMDKYYAQKRKKMAYKAEKKKKTIRDAAEESMFK